MASFSKPLVIGLMAIMLAGCPKGYGITCPTLKQYSPEFQDKALEEINIIEKTAPHVVKMFNDYGVTRDAIRTCIARQKAERKKNKV